MKESVSSEDVNPDLVHQSNEIIVLCFGKCSAAKNVLTHHHVKFDQQHLKIYWYCYFH